MSAAQFSFDHLVCEVPQLGTAPGFAWYELDWDDPAVVQAHTGFCLKGSARVIAATRRNPAAILRDVLPTLPAGVVTHLQFEVPEWDQARSTVDAVRGACVTPIPACHLPLAPLDPDQLRTAVEDLAALGTELIKLVFQATEVVHVRWAEALLRDWPHDRVGLSLTPAGDRQGRLTAALAGSRLVFAPLSDTLDRMSAHWYRRLAAPPVEDDQEGG